VKNSTLIVLALIALAVGVIGMAVLFGAPTGPPAARTYPSPGQAVYYLGVDAEGRAIPRTVAGGGMMGLGMMETIACVDCHGEDGRGGRFRSMFGPIDVADIRYSVLTSPRSEDGTTVPGWTDDDIARAIRDGVEPNGERLQAPMPRWDMTDSEIEDVISYLKELSSR